MSGVSISRIFSAIWSIGISPDQMGIARNRVFETGGDPNSSGWM